MSTNEEPVAIGDPFGLLEATTTTSTSTPQAATKSTTVYFLRSTDGSVALTPVQREVDVAANVQEILGNLFTVRPDGSEAPRRDRPDVGHPRERRPVGHRVRLGRLGSPGHRRARPVRQRRHPGQRPAQCAGPDRVDGHRRHRGAVTVSFRNNGAQVDAIVGNGQIADGPVNRNDYQNLS